DERGRLYVADRNSARIQVFNQDGKLLDQWANVVMPWGLGLARNGDLWVCGSSPHWWYRDGKYPEIKDQMFVRFSPEGKVRQVWTIPLGVKGKLKPGEAIGVHCIAEDEQGNLYVGDIYGERAQKFVPVSRRLPAVKIVTLGDSITRGVRQGVTDKETFAALLEQDLHKDNPEVSVVNVGIGGGRAHHAPQPPELAGLRLQPAPGAGGPRPQAGRGDDHVRHQRQLRGRGRPGHPHQPEGVPRQPGSPGRAAAAGRRGARPDDRAALGRRGQAERRRRTPERAPG